MDVAINATGGDDHAFTGDHLGRSANWHCHVRLHVGVAALADLPYTTVLEADICFQDAKLRINDQCVGDDGVSDFGGRQLRLAHAVTDHLAATELDLFAVGGEVALDLDEEFGIGKPHTVTGGRAEHLGVGAAGECAHRLPPVFFAAGFLLAGVFVAVFPAGFALASGPITLP